MILSKTKQWYLWQRDLRYEFVNALQINSRLELSCGIQWMIVFQLHMMLDVLILNKLQVFYCTYQPCIISRLCVLGKVQACKFLLLKSCHAPRKPEKKTDCCGGHFQIFKSKTMVDQGTLVACVFLYRMIWYWKVSLVSTHYCFISVNSVIMHFSRMNII